MKEQHETLGSNVVPLDYRLRIEPNFKTFKFDGRCEIDVDIKRATRSIEVNAKDLKIKSASVAQKSATQKAVVKMNPKLERIAIIMKTPLSGKVTIAIDYQGIHNDKLYGFYRSKYTYGKKGEKQGYILTTQFEAPDARAALPCFDEPEFKATFNLSLLVDNDLDTISNTPIKSSKKAGKKKLVTFQTTPKMSTYLLYMGVGRFEYLRDNNGRVKIAVATTPGKKELGKVALKCARMLLSEEERYFGIKFPLPKLDLIATPDFPVGAMENWGAITFREFGFLTDENSASVSVKQRIVEVIAHELVHQWFGDLVTMKWWNDLWLNESFATFMAFKFGQAVLPELNMHTLFYESEMPTALNADAYKHTHAISVNVDTSAQITALFDRISYSKGGCLLNMLEDYVGKDIFKDGLQRYLKKHMYGNATKSDLWKAIQESATAHRKNVEVTTVMETWVNQLGYPIIYAEKTKTGFALTQKRYTLSGAEYPEVWPIPIHYGTNEGETLVLMTGKSLAIKSKSPGIKLNVGQHGLYRTRYSEALLIHVGELIKRKNLSEIDAWGIENDVFAAVRTGDMKAVDYAKFVERYLMDASYPTTFSVSGHFSWLIDRCMGMRCLQQIKETSKKFHRKMLIKVGMAKHPGEDATTSRTRAVALSGLADAEDSEILRWGRNLFDNYAKGEAKIDGNLKGIVFAIAAKTHNNEHIIKKLLGMYSSEALPEDKARALAAISEVKNHALLKHALELGMSKEVRLQDALYIMGSALGSSHFRAMAWPWTKANWNKMLDYFPPTIMMLNKLVSALSGVSDEATKKDMENFFFKQKHAREDTEREVHLTIERIDANIRFMKTNA